LSEARRLYLASGNAGKLKEFQVLAAGHALALQLLPGFLSVPEFEENAPTFAENAAGKALYYSLHSRVTLSRLSLHELTAKSSKGRVALAASVMILCSSFRNLENHLPNCGRKKRTCSAIVARPSAA